LLSCRGVSFAYKNKVVLSDVNLSLSKPCLVGIIGHNGSAKTTLLKILGSSLPCQTGELFLLGEQALNCQKLIKSQLRQQIGLLFQETSSDDKISVYDNLSFYGRLMGISKLSISIKQVLERANLVGQAHEQVKKLSGGMIRRFELYRAFMHEPKILLLDEPSAGLDFAESAKFLTFARDYVVNNQAIVIFSSHRSAELECCDDLIMMHEGRIIAHDSPDNLLSQSSRWRLSITDKHGEAKSLLSRDDLNKLLGSGQLIKANIKSFSVSGPNVADVYAQVIGEIPPHEQPC